MLSFGLILLAGFLFAQGGRTVTGVVTDKVSGETLPGVAVQIKGTTIGVITNAEGFFSLSDVPANGVLVVSYLGMTTQEILLEGRTRVNVQLSEDSQNLEELVVVGYGTTKVKDLTSSITTVKASELVKSPTGQAMQALQGKVAGMQVVSSGAPGDAPTIRVRGIGSYPGSNNEAPLYVVDGMFFDNIDFLNTNDIASISVLKDASAAAIYGVRAANGVVLIETKSGSFKAKTEIVYDGYYGIQQAQNVLKMANSEQFSQMAYEATFGLDQLNSIEIEERIAAKDYNAIDYIYVLNAMERYGRNPSNANVPNVNTDWYAEILRPAAIQNHSISATGGADRASYSLGASYFSQDGILDMENNYNRFNLRSKVEFKATDWLTLGGNVVVSEATKLGQESSAWNSAYFAVPIMPVIDELNSEAWPDHYANAKSIAYRGAQNPLIAMSYNQNKMKSLKVMSNFHAKVDLIPNKLSFKTTYNHSYANINNRYVGLPYDMTQGINRLLSTMSRSVGTYSDKIWDNVLTYLDMFGKHSLTAMVGHSYRNERYEGLRASADDFPYENETTWYLDQALVKNAESIGDGAYNEYGLSYFGRLSYNYDDKYLLYGTVRADGSSKYQEKWGYFPTVGFGWVLSEEGFLKQNEVIDFLKFRGSWGQLGNDKIAASSGSSTTATINIALDGIKTGGTTSASTFSYLGWEVTEELNFGLSSAFLNNRLSVEADWYNRDTKNAAIAVKIPMVGGTIMRNGGVIRNSGIELELGWNDNITKDFSYNVGVNMSTLKNEVIDLYGQPYMDGGMAEFRQRSIVGSSLLAFYGYQVAGVYQNQEEIDADPVAVANNLIPGDFKYVDQQQEGEAGYGVINDDDRVVLGSYFPNFMFGGNMGFQYKNLELSATFMGQSGNKILNRKRGEVIWTNDQNMDADLAINRWHGEGTTNSYPSSAGLKKGWNQKMSDFLVEDGSFWRIQNIQLAYNFKNISMGNFKIPLVRLSFTADKPLTVFNYNGFTPEVPNGIDTQMYPVPAVYTVGLNVKF